MLDCILWTESDNLSEMGMDFILAEEQSSIYEEKYNEMPQQMKSPQKKHTRNTSQLPEFGERLLTWTMTHESDIA